jgi:hypothetical protein
LKQQKKRVRSNGEKMEIIIIFHFLFCGVPSVPFLYNILSRFYGFGTSMLWDIEE